MSSVMTMMRFSSRLALRAAARRGAIVSTTRTDLTFTSPRPLPLGAFSIATMTLGQGENLDNTPLPWVIHNSNFPEKDAPVFLQLFLEAADHNHDGFLSVQDMGKLLRYINADQPFDPDQVQSIMERDLGMRPNEHQVPVERVQQLLLKMNHFL